MDGQLAHIPQQLSATRLHRLTGEVLRAVRQGQRFVVLDRWGSPQAELVPVEQTSEVTV